MHQIRGRMAAGLNGSSTLPGIPAITYAFAAASRSVRELAVAGQLHSEAEGMERALCVMAEFFPVDGGREKIYNCISDAACAVLVERERTRNRPVASTHITKDYYRDGDALHYEIALV
jgi:3-oxoacyl-[acyl-carrier-protein] synthase III